MSKNWATKAKKKQAPTRTASEVAQRAAELKANPPTSAPADVLAVAAKLHAVAKASV